MKNMKHWVDIYPHIITASMITKENEMIDWKIGQYPLRDKYNVGALRKAGYKYVEKMYIANNSNQHNKAFNLAASWMKGYGVQVDPFRASCPWDTKF